MTIKKKTMVQMYNTMYRIRQFETKLQEFLLLAKFRALFISI